MQDTVTGPVTDREMILKLGTVTGNWHGLALGTGTAGDGGACPVPLEVVSCHNPPAMIRAGLVPPRLLLVPPRPL